MLRSALLSLIAATALSGAALAQSNDPSFRINNRTGSAIQEIYVSAASRSEWGRDLLGDNTLPNGQSFTIRIRAGQCMNDIRVVLDGGQALERMNVNTCDITDFNVTP